MAAGTRRRGSTVGLTAPVLWDPERYERFRDERARPFHDLLARVPDIPVRHAADLGCGTGDLTRLLLRRWPGASVAGVDSSPEMLGRARAGEPLPGLSWIEADMRTWEPERPLDLIVSNAVLHWVGDHVRLMPRLVSLLAPGGVLAAQIPHNRSEPAYDAVREVASDPRWASRVPEHSLRSEVMEPEWYLRTLTSLGLFPDVSETTYYHPLPTAAEIVEWLSGSTLRPLLTALTVEEGQEFLERLLPRLAASYPSGPGGVIFRFRRVFVVARRP